MDPLKALMSSHGIDNLATSDTVADVTDPERSLVSAVIWRALEDLHHRERTIRREAVAWVSAKTETPFSYLWCCSALDLSAAEIIQKIEKMGLFNWASPPSLIGFEGLADRWVPGFPLGVDPVAGIRRMPVRRAHPQVLGHRIRRGRR